MLRLILILALLCAGCGVPARVDADRAARDREAFLERLRGCDCCRMKSLR